MNRLTKKIKSAIPDDLVPAVEALNKTLDEAHFRWGRITEVFCYGLLHPGEKLEEIEEHKLALLQLKATVGAAVTETCHQQLRIGTAPAFFHAMNQLYAAGVTLQAVHVLQNLLEIGGAHSDQLGKPYVQWAHDLTLELVESYENRVKFWIRAVCDPPDYSSDLNWDDPDEIIMGKTWCAPMLLVMQPCRSMPFDAARQWERTDREASKRWLNAFAEMFTIHAKIRIDRIADAKIVELAKQSKSAPPHKAEVAPMNGSVQTNSAQDTPEKLNVKQEYRKRETSKRNRKIQSEFRRLEKRKPGMSNVWYSQQLSNLEVAGGLNAETIRKIIVLKKVGRK